MVDDIPAALAQLPLTADATAADRAYWATEASAGVEAHAPPWATEAAAALRRPSQVSLWTTGCGKTPQAAATASRVPAMRECPLVL